MKILNPKFGRITKVFLVLLQVFFINMLYSQKGVLYIPSVAFTGAENMCGLTYKEISRAPILDGLPTVGASGLKWYDSDMQVISNETTSILHTNKPGIYYFEQMVNGQIYAPQLVIVGYNIDWSQFQNTVAQPTGNSLQVTLPDNANTTSGTAYSVNRGVLAAGTDQFVYMEVSDLINNFGYGNLLENRLEITWSLNSGYPSPVMMISNAGSQYKVGFYPTNGVYYNVSDGDNLLMELDGATGALNFRINGISKYTRPAQSNYLGGARIYGHIHKGRDFNDPQNKKSAIYNCISTQSCSETVYYELKRAMNAEYYWAYTDKVYFRYVEEYNNEGENLTYEIIGSSGTVILSSANTSHPVLLKEFGDNRFKLDVSAYRNVLSSGFYTMRILNAKSEVRFLKFKLD
jgi:hypothetical protein